ncbi:Uncharacterised protein [Yersinia massiliensis]|nr:Uncharacterised protein [Yersinia massiliensis]
MFEYLVIDSKLSSLNISLKSVYSDFKNKKHSIDIIDVSQLLLHIELFQKNEYSEHLTIVLPILKLLSNQLF